ncbi:hypothetical protein EDB86DRAFT_2892943 [Lactarius hatsudake]|nr:hypothetical protein EDB86DRAFT_3003171 [Lactarius hatsudake]KAH8977614.1 hypothetical protein EDB86DRAFT_3001126 [Lactarius hatsudake]KAH8999998.1 hypothetical protein EDB86DRAFT_2906923 [Lactarius hatsudake]KAH9003525.1 hypothetical protein EDB86DRAFT_2892943 [Lactarius hatsudake]
MYIYNTLSRATTQPLPPPQAVPTRYCQQTALVSPFSVFAHRRSIKSLCKRILENKLLQPPGFAPSVPSLSAIGTSFFHSPFLPVDSPFPPPFLHTLLLLCSWDDDDDERAATEGTLPDWDTTPLQPPRTVRPNDDYSDDGSDGDKGNNQRCEWQRWRRSHNRFIISLFHDGEPKFK